MTIVKDGTTYDGVITDVSSMADESNGLFKIKAELPEANSLSTGSTVKVTLTGGGDSATCASKSCGAGRAMKRLCQPLPVNAFSVPFAHHFEHACANMFAVVK